MEDHRGRLRGHRSGVTPASCPGSLTVIPGLKSRFNKYLFFADYNGQQLYDIFLGRVKSNDYRLDDQAAQAIKEHLEELYEDRDQNFGNARDVRNLFERIVANQANRVSGTLLPY